MQKCAEPLLIGYNLKQGNIKYLVDNCKCMLILPVLMKMCFILLQFTFIVLLLRIGFMHAT